jgi:hypothetical protein
MSMDTTAMPDRASFWPLVDQNNLDCSATIRAKLAAGTLPATRPSQVWVGESRGETCDGCDQPIAPGNIEYEANLADQGVFLFHRGCFDLWHQERASRVDEASAPAPSIGEALWQFLASRRGEMFFTLCLGVALRTGARLDRALLVAEGRGAGRRHGTCSMCGKHRLLCGLASS